MCPANRLGTVDLFVVSHHGQAISNSDVLVHAIEPRVALINNGSAQGRSAGRDEGAAHGARHGGHLAAALLAVERTGIHGAGHVHRQPRRRSAGGDADCAHDPPGPRGWHPAGAAAGARRAGVLDQGLRERGRIVHRHQRAQWVHEDVRGPAGCATLMTGNAIPTRALTSELFGAPVSSRINLRSAVRVDRSPAPPSVRAQARASRPSCSCTAVKSAGHSDRPREIPRPPGILPGVLAICSGV